MCSFNISLSFPFDLHHRRYAPDSAVGVAVALGITLALAVALELALALALALASASLPMLFNTPLLIRTMTAITAPATMMANRIQKSQQMRVRRFFFDCWRASQDSL